MRCGLWIVCLFLVAGCYLTGDLPPDAPTPPSTSPTIPTMIAQDAAGVMAGICFEAALDAAGQVFVLRSTEDLIRFYDLADNSTLCPQPVERLSFDFDNGQVLAGLWNTGIGCTARHEIDAMTRDDDSRQIIIQARFIVDGGCDYELVRPFWLALDQAAGYEIDLRIGQPPPP